MHSIRVKNLAKEFKIGYVGKQTTLQRLFSLAFYNERRKLVRVLNNISFEVNKGEIVGIIGLNGSGKSTLLRILAGIYSPDQGTVFISGRLIPIINLHMGLQPRLTGKENIYLVGSLFGLSPKEIRLKLGSIVQFAGLQKYINTKLYQFSTGMIERLAFSIAIHSDPEILLLDEIFAVGDEQFRLKSITRLKELVGRGTTIVFVSHELALIEQFCNRVIFLHKGEIMREGKPREVTSAYHHFHRE